MKDNFIAIIGAGNMGCSLIAGLIASGFPAHHIIASHPHFEKLETLKKAWPLQVTTENIKAIEKADVILFCVKPNVVRNVCEELKNINVKNKLFISIAAGISTHHMEAWIGQKIPLVRAMPNTPAMV